MLVSQRTVDEIKPKDYVRPRIETDEYFFRWNEVSFGIPRGEESKFKIFVTDVIPMLGILQHQAKQTQKIGENSKKLSKHQLNEAYTPLSTLVSTGACVRYIIGMTWDEQIFINVEESIHFSKENGNLYHSQLQLCWWLGTLEKKNPDGV